MISKKQMSVIRYLAKVRQSTLYRIYMASDYQYHHNELGNFSKVMSSLVKSGRVKRVQHGIYEIADIPENQGLIEYYKGL